MTLYIGCAPIRRKGAAINVSIGCGALSRGGVIML